MRKSFIEAERHCGESFAICKKWYHLFTSGKNTPAFLINDTDMNFGVNLLARCTVEHPALTIVAFALMDNHLHIVLSGNEDEISEFFSSYRRRLSRYLFAKDGSPIPNNFRQSLKDIPDLKAMRNTIAYVNRNGFVAHPECTPFSYRWSSGREYFNVKVKGINLSSLTVDECRSVFRGRFPKILQNAEMIEGCVSCESFCDLQLGMSMFRDAHHYLSLVTKGVEAYSNLAGELDDDEFLTDPEVYTELVRILREKYSGALLRELSKAQKFDLARYLHYTFRSSTGQICRLLGLPKYDIDQMFSKY